MRKIARICFLLLVSSGSLIAGGGYKKIKEGKWPFETQGIRFSPYIQDNWTYSTSALTQQYVIYFYREGNDRIRWREEGGIQLNPVVQLFAGPEQLITYLKSAENISSDPQVQVLTNEMVPDKKYGDLCVRFSRTFTVKLPPGESGPPETIRDEGYYFVHPSNNKMIVKIHLFRRASDAIADATFGDYMEKFYRNFSTTNTFVPAWTIGVNYFVGFGFDETLYFGYNDATTGDRITADAGAGSGLHLCAYRRIKSIWVGGAEVGFSTASALSGIYDNLDARMTRGFVAEINGGALLLSKFRHRALLTAGPVYYSSPKLVIRIDDPAGPGDVTFQYKPAFGFNVNAQYVYVLRRNRGQLVFGFKYHGVNLSLDKFETNGQSNDPSTLNPSYNSFKRVNANNLAMVLFGYQYTFD